MPTCQRANEPDSWPDVLAPGLAVVFVGFNPSLVAWRRGHYYANPVNNFYRLLHEVGLTPRRLDPTEDRTLPAYGIGLTDLLLVPSANASDYPAARFRAGRTALLAKLASYRPAIVCFNGAGVFRHVFGRQPARWGEQPDLQIGDARVFVVPSTSGAANGLAAVRRQAFAELAAAVREMRRDG